MDTLAKWRINHIDFEGYLLTVDCRLFKMPYLSHGRHHSIKEIIPISGIKAFWIIQNGKRKKWSFKQLNHLRVSGRFSEIKEDIILELENDLPF